MLTKEELKNDPLMDAIKRYKTFDDRIVGFFERLFCRHNWRITATYADYGLKWKSKLNEPSIPTDRECTKCRKFQWRSLSGDVSKNKWITFR